MGRLRTAKKFPGTWLQYGRQARAQESMMVAIGPIQRAYGERDCREKRVKEASSVQMDFTKGVLPVCQKWEAEPSCRWGYVRSSACQQTKQQLPQMGLSIDPGKQSLAGHPRGASKTAR